jgi:hypothetical protein
VFASQATEAVVIVQIDRASSTAYVDRAGTIQALDLKTYAGRVAFALALQQLKDLAFIAETTADTKVPAFA